MDELINKYKVIVCVGSGGVGKTTLAATIGVVAARAGRRVLVLTIDPARRLMTALGLDRELGSREASVPLADVAGELSAAMVDSQAVFERFIRLSAPHPEAAERLLKNRLYQQLATTLSGSQEFTSMECLYEAEQRQQFDLIILDTPPAQHALDFLRSPERLMSLFQDSVTQWFRSSGTETGFFLKRFLHTGTRTVFRALERITGSQFVGELAEFFASIYEVQDRVRERTNHIHELLRSPTTGFVVVTGFDEGKLEEAWAFQQELRQTGLHLGGVIVNRAFPQWVGSASSSGEAVLSSDENLQEVFLLFEKFARYHQLREEIMSRFQKRLQGVPVIRLPDFDRDVQGTEGLMELADELVQRSRQENQ